MKVADARLAFKIENYVVPTVKLNFKSDKKFKSEGYLCSDCRIEVTGPVSSSEVTVNSKLVTESLTDVRVRGKENIPGASPLYQGFIDSQSHILNFCTANTELRRGKDLNDLSDCVAIFKEVILRRTNQA